MHVILSAHLLYCLQYYHIIGMFLPFCTPFSILVAMLGILLSITPYEKISRLNKFMSAAPLAQLFGVEPFEYQPPGSMLDLMNMSSLGASNITDTIMNQIMYNQTVDIEELVMSLLGNDYKRIHRRHRGRSSTLFIKKSELSSLPWIHRTTWEDLCEAMPWILSFILFVVVPFAVKVSETIRYRRLSRQYRDRKEQIISASILIECLQKFRKVSPYFHP